MSKKLLDTLQLNTSDLEKLCEQYEIDLLVLFGSAARQREHSNSDIDLAYARQKRLDFEERAKIVSSLRKLSDIEDRDFDLVWLKGADPLHLRKISEDAVPLVGSSERFQQFRRRAFHKYSDYKPFLAREKEETAKRIQDMKSS